MAVSLVARYRWALYQRGACRNPSRQLGQDGVEPSVFLALSLARSRLTSEAVGPAAIRASQAGMPRDRLAPIVSA